MKAPHKQKIHPVGSNEGMDSMFHWLNLFPSNSRESKETRKIPEEFARATKEKRPTTHCNEDGQRKAKSFLSDKVRLLVKRKASRNFAKASHVAFIFPVLKKTYFDFDVLDVRDAFHKNFTVFALDMLTRCMC